jgi:membrane protease subunit HflK
MRAVLATVSLDDAIGAGRSDIESRVSLVMQQVLDRYGAGVRIEGIAIKQSDPPATVNNAFKEVSAAQQEAQSYINQARAYAQQQTARAQGDAAAFDKVYAQYKLAPDVTRRRMYYETMERVLSKVDKTVIEAPGVTPYLPLPEVSRRAQEGAAR